MILQTLKIIAGIATIITGIVSLFWPLKYPDLLGWSQLVAAALLRSEPSWVLCLLAWGLPYFM